MIAHQTDHVSIINVWIHVLAHVDRMRNVELQTTRLHVTAYLDILEILCMHAHLFYVSSLYFISLYLLNLSLFRIIFVSLLTFIFTLAIPVHVDPCHPSPCGPYSNCRTFNGHAVCTCLEMCIGSPPNCRPECIVSSDCRPDKACINQKCKDPCPGMCGLNAQCQIVNHNPICSCLSGFTGDPFVRCFTEESKCYLFEFTPIYFNDYKL